MQQFDIPITQTFLRVLLAFSNVSAVSTRVENADMKKNVIQTFLRVFRAFSEVSAFSTKVENVDIKKMLFKRFYAFSEHFLRCPRFPLKWKMRT